MNNKKGFTLIELLAVIVVLAIIALIVTPIISKIVGSASEQANMRSVEGHIGNINNNLASKMLFNNYTADGTYTFDGLGFTNYPTTDPIRCSSYEISKNRVVSATSCMVKEKSYCYSNSRVESCENMGNLDNLVLRRVNEIRNTPNTDISGRTGNIYYVSAEGDDSNDGLSEATPFKTIDKIEDMFNNNLIPAGSTILFRDGDMFRGKIKINVEDILLGSYGDISKGKPTITRSLYDGAKEGTWTEVKPNIWKYQVDGADPFIYDVGVIWFFCNEGNNNCDKSMNTIDRKFTHTKKVATPNNYDETNLESKIDTLLTHDLETYHAGHPNARNAKAKELYLYSVGNPKDRFDEIEFAQAFEPVYIHQDTGKFSVDNISIKYTSSSGILLWADTANFIVTNTEIGFIGGAVHSFEGDRGFTFYGNGINLYGSVTTANGVPVTDGFVIKNCYVYQAFDAGVSFQKSVDTEARMEKALFKNNVFEYSNYNIEYWTFTSSSDPVVVDNSYIGDATYENNILRKAGYGICETRPDRGNGAHLRNWNRSSGYNILKGNFIIRNNIFDGAYDQFIYLNATYYTSLPTIVNNTFYGEKDDIFGYYFSTDTEKQRILFDKYLLALYFPNNNIVITDDYNFSDDSGSTGDATWAYDATNGKLTISGSGEMADYTESNLPPWYNYRDRIYKIEVGEDVTKLGTYAFYNLTRVVELRINSKTLSALPSDGNYTLYNIGNDTLGTKLIFGSEVTTVPAYLTKTTSENNTATNIIEVVFEGTNVKQINGYSINSVNITTLKIPYGVTTIASSSTGKNKKLKFFVGGDSTTNYAGWSFREDASLEKVVLGDSISTIKDATFRACYDLKTLVIPHLKTPSTAGADMFKGITGNVDVYGDDSVQTWLNNVKSASSQTNLIYHPISEYVITVTSNTGINETVSYNGEYTFTTDRDVDIKMYYDASDGKRYSVDADYTKEGNTYTITKIKSDIYIDIK